jgi:hypothetical protein
MEEARGDAQADGGMKMLKLTDKLKTEISNALRSSLKENVALLIEDFKRDLGELNTDLSHDDVNNIIDIISEAMTYGGAELDLSHGRPRIVVNTTEFDEIVFEEFRIYVDTEADFEPNEMLKFLKEQLAAVEEIASILNARRAEIETAMHKLMGE